MSCEQLCSPEVYSDTVGFEVIFAPLLLIKQPRPFEQGYTLLENITVSHIFDEWHLVFQCRYIPYDYKDFRLFFQKSPSVK